MYARTTILTSQASRRGRAVKAIGAVSFLNTRPLVYGLEGRDDFRIRFGVPSLLGNLLATGEVDAALVPVVDLGRHADRWEAVSDACIASDGPTLTVQVFARRPVESITRLHADTDSHTSVALSRIVFAGLCGREPEMIPLDARGGLPEECEAVLLIGDKVATMPMIEFPHRLDLGAAWKQMTGLPFVFAVWAGRRGEDHAELAAELSAARDAGLAAIDEIVAEQAPLRGWPVDLARRYLTRYLKFRLDERMQAGMGEFLARARNFGMVGAA